MVNKWREFTNLICKESLCKRVEEDVVRVFGVGDVPIYNLKHGCLKEVVSAWKTNQHSLLKKL